METQHKIGLNISNVPANKLSQVDYDFRKLVEGLPAAIYICNKEGKITFYNQSAAELWGRNPNVEEDYWCGSLKMYKINGTPLSLDECPMALTLKGAKHIKGEEIIIERGDGTRVYVLNNPKLIFDALGNIDGAINLLVDITEKREGKKELSESKDKNLISSKLQERKNEGKSTTLKKNQEWYYRMIEEVSDYAILLLDNDGNILNWNKGAEQIKGYKEEEIIGKNFRLFYLEDDRIAKIPESLITQAVAEGRASNEGWRLRKDGTRFWGSIVITALHDEENNIVGFSKVTKDLTQKKLSDDQLKQYTRDIEFQNKQLEAFAYVASHDLQEPLRKIQTFADILNKNIDDKTSVKKYLEKIHSSSRRMSNLIEAILTYSQLSNSSEIFTSVDLNAVIENIKDDFELLISERKVIFNCGKLPLVKAVPIQMHQLFSNLINNAIKFSNDNPKIEITNKILNKDQVLQRPFLNSNSRYLEILVKDNGIGFEPQYAEQVFKLFKRLHDFNQGTGIGLALVKKVVENHNGHITVDSKPNVGTVFTIYLPFK